MWLQEYEVVKARAAFANSQALMIKIGMWPAFIPLRDVADASPEHYVTKEVGRGCLPHHVSLGSGNFAHHLAVTWTRPTLCFAKQVQQGCCLGLGCQKVSSFVCGVCQFVVSSWDWFRLPSRKRRGKGGQGLDWWRREAFLR